MRFGFVALVASVLGGALGQATGWAYADRTTEAAAREARLAESATLLASDEFEGRGPGTKGIDLAADYIAKQFAEIGLKTDLYDGTPFQKFSIPIGAQLGEKNEVKLVGPLDSAGKPINEVSLKLNEEFTPLSLGGSSSFDLPLVFVGYGITAPDEHYDDYAGIDVTGKAVIVLRHEPQQDNPHGAFEGTKHSDFATFTRKVSNAYEHGAAAVIFVSSDAGVRKEVARRMTRWQESLAELAARDAKFKESAKPSLAEIRGQVAQVTEQLVAIQEQGDKLREELDPLVKFNVGSGDDVRPKFPVLHCRRAAIEPLIQAALGTDLAELEKSIDDGPTPHSRELAGCRIQGEITVLRNDVEIKNVVGVLEGEGPLADETIVIGAHYDHLGRGDAGSLAAGAKEIHNGADDNGSGTATLLEVARQLATLDRKLPRRIVFIAFTAEERGLIGSARYVREPLFPLDKTVAMLNMDMVGRLDQEKLIVYGTGTADLLDQLVDRFNEAYGFQISKKPSGFGPSDHSSFYAKKIPVLHLFTGTHKDYHRPSDDSEKLNIAGMRKIGEFLTDLTIALAESPERPAYKATGRGAEMGSDESRPYFGSIPDFSQERPGYALSGVTKDGPADKGGLKEGDIIIKLGESKIGGLEDFDSALRKYKGGDSVAVVVQRGNEEVTLTVKLENPK
ncbi:MAG: M20/M25/M40 family metallo-hydrolase [Planctomycetaceae bacterium]|nr:M20/M25/M40 family metallo-hydrolase [Planctomycetaceae bacterium]